MTGEVMERRTQTYPVIEIVDDIALDLAPMLDAIVIRFQAHQGYADGSPAGESRELSPILLPRVHAPALLEAIGLALAAIPEAGTSESQTAQ